MTANAYNWADNERPASFMNSVVIMEKELTDRAQSIHERILQLRDSL
jgi:hypothetical protein